MVTLRTADNPNIAVLVEAMKAVSRETEPNRALYAFGSRLNEIRPVDVFVSVSTRGLAPGEYKITRHFRTFDVYADHASPEMIDEQNPWRRWLELPTHRGGFVGEVIESGEPQLLQHLDIRGDPALGDEVADMGSCIAVPIFDRGVALNWTIQFRASPEGFNLEALEQMLQTANLFGTATRNLVALKQVQELHDRLEHQSEEVARVQQMLLPKRLPKIPGLNIATSYLTQCARGRRLLRLLPVSRWAVGDPHRRRVRARRRRRDRHGDAPRDPARLPRRAHGARRDPALRQ